MKRHRKIYLKTACMVLITFILSGCWDIKDINHRVLPVAIGVSKSGDEYNILLHIPEPGKDETAIKLVTGRGETITKAVDNISRDMESAVDLLHVKIVIIDEKTAKSGVEDIISGFMRSREVSPKALIAICDDDINDFFSKSKNSLGPEGTNIFDFFEKNAGWSPQIALTRVWEVYRSIHSNSIDVAIPMITTGKTTIFEQVGSAVLKTDKMVEEISPAETLLFNVFKREGAHGEIEVLDHASVMIVKDKMYHKRKFENNIPYLDSHIYLKVVVLETRGNPTTGVIEKELKEVLSNRFDVMFTKIQHAESDILGIGQFFRDKIKPRELKKWRKDYYPKLEIQTHFKVDIQHEGYLKTT